MQPCHEFRGVLSVMALGESQSVTGPDAVVLHRQNITTTCDGCELTRKTCLFAPACTSMACLNWQQWRLTAGAAMNVRQGQLYAFVLDELWDTAAGKVACVGVSPAAANHGGASSLRRNPNIKPTFSQYLFRTFQLPEGISSSRDSFVADGERQEGQDALSPEVFSDPVSASRARTLAAGMGLGALALVVLVVGAIFVRKAARARHTMKTMDSAALWDSGEPRPTLAWNMQPDGDGFARSPQNLTKYGESNSHTRMLEQRRLLMYGSANIYALTHPSSPPCHLFFYVLGLLRRLGTVVRPGDTIDIEQQARQLGAFREEDCASNIMDTPELSRRRHLAGMAVRPLQLPAEDVHVQAMMAWRDNQDPAPGMVMYVDVISVKPSPKVTPKRLPTERSSGGAAVDPDASVPEPSSMSQRAKKDKKRQRNGVGVHVHSSGGAAEAQAGPATLAWTPKTLEVPASPTLIRVTAIAPQMPADGRPQPHPPPQAAGAHRRSNSHVLRVRQADAHGTETTRREAWGVAPQGLPDDDLSASQ